jgi:hypothetical protein
VHKQNVGEARENIKVQNDLSLLCLQQKPVVQKQLNVNDTLNK